MYKDELEDEPETEDSGTGELLVPGPEGRMLPLSKFQAMVQTGCGSCSGEINVNHAHEIEWFAGEPICHNCSDNDVIREQLGFEPKKRIMVH
jgi:hypothetical protein